MVTKDYSLGVIQVAILHQCGHTAERPLTEYNYKSRIYQPLNEIRHLNPPANIAEGFSKKVAKAEQRTVNYWQDKVCPDCFTANLKEQATTTGTEAKWRWTDVNGRWGATIEADDDKIMEYLPQVRDVVEVHAKSGRISYQQVVEVFGPQEGSRDGRSVIECSVANVGFHKKIK